VTEAIPFDAVVVLDPAERVILAFALAVEARDSYKADHVRRVADSARRLGGLAGMAEPELDDLWFGAAIHDIGKIGVPDTILLKRARLTTGEMGVMRRHTEVGSSLVEPMRARTCVRDVVRHHHERVDGGGYPDGLTGDAIPLPARIAAVCDGFDAMTTVRLYRQNHAPQQAMNILRQGAGSHWDARLVDLFLESVADERPVRPRPRTRRRFPYIT
jgi:HD-GYP domain-containing protein (c-di-GMP phosphodiesterase class II)